MHTPDLNLSRRSRHHRIFGNIYPWLQMTRNVLGAKKPCRLNCYFLLDLAGYCAFGLFETLFFFLFQGPACARSAYQDHRSQGKDRGCVQEEVSHHLQTTARANRVVFPPGSAYIRTIVDLQIYQHFR